MKKGFTLAEVLITLAIIGVVAALTIPSLVTRVQKANIGPTLAKVVNTLENVNIKALNDNEARNLTDIVSEEDGYAAFLDGKLNGYREDNDVYTKDGIEYSCHTVANLDPFIHRVEVDINGDDEPNEKNEDQFTFFVDPSGRVIPFGSKEYVKMRGLTTSAATIDDCATHNALTAYSACTGAIADNNWKFE